MEATFTLLLEGTRITVHSQKRPFCDTFLETMGRKFDIGLFTASRRQYAEVIANWLDAKRNVIQYVFHRDHCIRTNGRMVKDLKAIGCDVKTTIIIDNLPSCFENQSRNGLPCKSFYGGEVDTELQKLMELLIEMDTTHGDIRYELARVRKELRSFRKLRQLRASTEELVEAQCLPNVPAALGIFDL